MKGFVKNSPLRKKWRKCWTKISFGFQKEIMNFRNGHITVYKYYSFLFWTLELNRAWMKLPTKQDYENEFNKL